MKHLNKDYFLDPNCPLYQHPEHFHFNSDTKCLAQFMELKKNETVLDIGTNNGALLLAADQYDVKELIGIEVLEEAADVAEYNMQEFANHPYRILRGRVQDISMDPVNVIVCNPPYFSEKATNHNTKMDMRQLGRIESNLTLEEFIQSCHRLLISNGRLYFVHRPNRLNEIVACLHANHFKIKRIQFVYADADHPAKSVLIEARHEGQCDCTVMEPLFL